MGAAAVRGAHCRVAASHALVLLLVALYLPVTGGAPPARLLDVHRFSAPRAPAAMPPPLVDAFTRGGTHEAVQYFVDDTRDGAGMHIVFSAAQFLLAVDAANRTLAAHRARRELFFRVNPLAPAARDAAWARSLPATQWLQDALLRREADIRGARCVVFGSTGGADEALLLALGAAHVTVVEHQRLSIAHPAVRVLSVIDARKAYCAAGAAAAEGAPAGDDAAWERFDVALSVSSFDHDGLGRYGDPVSPDADLLAMDEVRCAYLRREAAADAAAALDAAGVATAVPPPRSPRLLILTVPVGPDAVVWNAMRRYGPVRLPLLTHGYELAGSVGFDEARVRAPAALKGKSYEPVLLLTPLAAASGGAAAADAECALVRRVNCEDGAPTPLAELLRSTQEPPAAAAA